MLRDTVLETEDKAQVLFDYFLDNREWQVFFGLNPDESQLARLEKIVELSNWLLKNPDHSKMEREAQDFEWKRIDLILDEIARHPERYTETFRPLRKHRELREGLGSES